MHLNIAVGDTIRKLRHERKLTLRQMSGFISTGHLSDVEHGRKQLSNDLLEVVAEGLSLTTAELILEIYKYLKNLEDK